jgi:hypothetical protein
MEKLGREGKVDKQNVGSISKYLADSSQNHPEGQLWKKCRLDQLLPHKQEHGRWGTFTCIQSALD